MVLLPQYKEHFDRLLAAFAKMLSDAKVTRFISPAAKKEIADIFCKFVNFNGKVLTYQQLRYDCFASLRHFSTCSLLATLARSSFKFDCFLLILMLFATTG